MGHPYFKPDTYAPRKIEHVPATPRKDTHAITAAEMFDVSLPEVTAEMRAYGRLSNMREIFYAGVYLKMQARRAAAERG